MTAATTAIATLLAFVTFPTGSGLFWGKALPTPPVTGGSPVPPKVIRGSLGGSVIDEGSGGSALKDFPQFKQNV
jgi:hypothetical protein